MIEGKRGTGVSRNLSETTQPARLTVLIPNSHTPCLLNCLLGDHTTSLSRVQVHLSPISVVIKKSCRQPCPLPPLLPLQTSSSFSENWVRQGRQGGDLCFQLGQLVPRAEWAICTRKPAMARGQESFLALPTSPQSQCAQVPNPLCRQKSQRADAGLQEENSKQLKIK